MSSENESQSDNKKDMEDIPSEVDSEDTDNRSTDSGWKVNPKTNEPGVFAFSEGQEIDLKLMEKETSRPKEVKEIRAQDILASLPCVERLRAICGSTASGGGSGERSETGENISDRESVTSGVVTRNLRNNKKNVKVSKSNSTKKATGLSTRSSKGKGRRTLAKKKPVKSIQNFPTPVTSEKIYHKGEFFTVGDIVSVTDVSGDLYYAQLRGFLTDEFGEKSAAMSWLIPTTGSPPPNEGFHPATYIIGPEEDIPRKMEVFTFVMHAPSDYFLDKNSPYRTEGQQRDACNKKGFTSVRLGPRVIRTVDGKRVFVGKS